MLDFTSVLLKTLSCAMGVTQQVPSGSSLLRAGKLRCQAVTLETQRGMQILSKRVNQKLDELELRVCARAGLSPKVTVIAHISAPSVVRNSWLIIQETSPWLSMRSRSGQEGNQDQKRLRLLI